MSLTVSGQVNRTILYWNDGDRSGTYAGLDNVEHLPRFISSGEAKISPNLKAGVEIMTEWNLGGRTSSVDQNSPDGAAAACLRRWTGVAGPFGGWKTRPSAGFGGQA